MRFPQLFDVDIYIVRYGVDISSSCETRWEGKGEFISYDCRQKLNKLHAKSVEFTISIYF